MDEAKVVINIKEGIIEMEGPADFVRYCLDTYQPAIKGLLGMPQDIAGRPEKAGPLPEVSKAAAVTRGRRRKRVSVMGAIRSDLDAGFFDEPRSTGEIKRRLGDAGITFTDSGVRANLRRLTMVGSLDAVRKGRSVRFRRRAGA